MNSLRNYYIDITIQYCSEILNNNIDIINIIRNLSNL